MSNDLSAFKLKDLSNIKDRREQRYLNSQKAPEDSVVRLMKQQDCLLESLRKTKDDLLLQNQDLINNPIRNLFNMFQNEPAPAAQPIDEPEPQLFDNLLENDCIEILNEEIEALKDKLPISPLKEMDVPTKKLINQPVVFLQFGDEELLEIHLMRLISRICKRGLIIIKLRDPQSVRRLDQILFKEEYRYQAIYRSKVNFFKMKELSRLDVSHLEILLIHDSNTLPQSVHDKCKSFIHFDLPNSISQYIEDLQFCNVQCVSFTLSQPQLLVEQRNQYLKDFLDIETSKKLFADICGDQSPYFREEQLIMQTVNLQNLCNTYDLEEKTLHSYLNKLQEQKKILILSHYPSQVRLSLCRNDYGDESLYELVARSIRQNGRKLISLRKTIKNQEHYQVNLKDLSVSFAMSHQQMADYIKTSSYFQQPEFFDYEYQIKVLDYTFINIITVEVTQKIRSLEEVYTVFGRFKDNKFNNDIDLKLQHEFHEYLKNPRIFDQNLPYTSINLLRQKNQIRRDILKLIDLGANKSCQILQIMLGNNLSNKYRDSGIVGRYKDYRYQELIPLIQEELVAEPEDHREQGWVIKRIKMC